MSSNNKTEIKKGWISDVNDCIKKLEKDEFTLQEIYKFSEELKEKYPNNHHIEDKIRQMLQELRDAGVIQFLDNNGNYRKISANRNLNNTNDLIIGNIYTNEQICKVFKCSLMSGMAKSNTTNTLVLVANHTKSLYDDKWINDVLHYTGEGQKGNQELSKQNKTLYESGSNGIKVFLFEVFKKTEYYYQGEVYLAEEPYKDRQNDINGNERDVWIFPIKLVEGKAKIDLNVIKDNEKKKENAAKKLSDSKLNENVKKVKSTLSKREVKTTHIDRNSYVKEKTKRRANGICDLCKKEAPFNKKDNTPFLEPHHVIPLADDGPDQIYNTVALCPNCHRKMHHLKDPKDIKELTKMIYKYLTSEEDIEFIG